MRTPAGNDQQSCQRHFRCVRMVPPEANGRPIRAATSGSESPYGVQRSHCFALLLTEPRTARPLFEEPAYQLVSAYWHCRHYLLD